MEPNISHSLRFTEKIVRLNIDRHLKDCYRINAIPIRLRIMEEFVVLVDEADRELGTKEKLAAHQANDRHRAVSVFLFNRNQELLLQQRAISKYHSGGLWTNTCCGHPRPGESPPEAARRRLKEEMGVSCDLQKKFDFVYQVALGKDLFEHEFDHVFVGEFDGKPKLNPLEAMNWKWMSLDNLQKDIGMNPEQYTAWFKIILEMGILSKC